MVTLTCMSSQYTLPRFHMVCGCPSSAVLWEEKQNKNTGTFTHIHTHCMVLFCTVVHVFSFFFVCVCVHFGSFISYLCSYSDGIACYPGCERTRKQNNHSDLSATASKRHQKLSYALSQIRFTLRSCLSSAEFVRNCGNTPKWYMSMNVRARRSLSALSDPC